MNTVMLPGTKAASCTAYDHIGQTHGMADHDHDLVHELSRRLDAAWRYDQYVANADGCPEIQEFWREVKRQDLDNIKRLRELVKSECRKECF